MTRGQAVIIGTAFFQELAFNLYLLWPSNFIDSVTAEGITTEHYNALATDQWRVHSIGVYVGLLAMTCGYMFIERNIQTKPLLVAWAAYMGIQVLKQFGTPNDQMYELCVDTILFISLFGAALLIAKWRPTIRIEWIRKH